MSTRRLLCSPVAMTLAAAGFLGGCANYATLQEADTLPAGSAKKGVGVTYTSYKVESGDSTDTVNVPAVNLWYRRGLTDQLEAHAAVWIPFGASIGAKYQLLGNRARSGPSLSLGLDLGFLQITSEDEQGEDVTATIVDTYVPVYLGYRFAPSFASYLSPKYILRVATGDGGTDVEHLAGGTLGLVLGRETSLLLEGTVMYDAALSAPAFQGGVGIAF